jgi:hypothetical protein
MTHSTLLISTVVYLFPQTEVLPSYLAGRKAESVGAKDQGNEYVN